MYQGPLLTREQFEDAERSWTGFSDEWTPWRRMAQEQGIAYAPNGTEHDDIDVPRPSQRAILYRAIDETPDLLAWAIRTVDKPSWASVVGRVLAGLDEMREQLDMEPEPAREDLAPSQSTYRLKEILDIIKDSTGSDED